jgi:hypothetical protein
LAYYKPYKYIPPSLVENYRVIVLKVLYKNYKEQLSVEKVKRFLEADPSMLVNEQLLKFFV